MALFEQMMNNCAATAGEAYINLMDQDWNHWKLQMQSWMEDVNETETKDRAAGDPQCGPSSSRCGPAPTCGSAYRRRGPPNSCRREEPVNPLEALHQMWTQFANAGQQRQRTTREETSNNQVNNEQRKYVIKLDVQHFEPNEISVKIVDNDIVVDGEHSERTDRLGRVSRKFQRKYELPADVEPNTIVSTMTPSGVLIIEGLKKKVPNESDAGIVIPVIREQTDSGVDLQSNYENEQQMD